jgi:hypothetical protein
LSFLLDQPNTDYPVLKIFSKCEIGANRGEKFSLQPLVGGERYGCRDLAKAALSAIDDWLDEEIVGFEPE